MQKTFDYIIQHKIIFIMRLQFVEDRNIVNKQIKEMQNFPKKRVIAAAIFLLFAFDTNFRVKIWQPTKNYWKAMNHSERFFTQQEHIQYKKTIMKNTEAYLRDLLPFFYNSQAPTHTTTPK